jgi:hypothetical protein
MLTALRRELIRAEFRAESRSHRPRPQTDPISLAAQILHA